MHNVGYGAEEGVSSGTLWYKEGRRQRVNAFLEKPRGVLESSVTWCKEVKGNMTAMKGRALRESRRVRVVGGARTSKATCELVFQKGGLYREQFAEVGERSKEEQGNM